MQKYHPKTPVASAADKLLRALVAVGLGVGWFVFLWGLSLPALTAGVAMGGLLWLCARQFSKRSVAKREKQMRRVIGGELALERLLLLPPRHAAFQAALWITPRAPVSLQRAADWGVVGTLDGRTVLIRLIAQHESVPVNVQQVVEALRDTREQKADTCILCLTAPATREALRYAAGLDPPLRVFERSEMIDLAGLCSPATDEDLSRLAHRRRKRRTTREWAETVLDASRARRYFWYGAVMALLALLTRQPVFPLPAALCLTLFAACEVRKLWRARRTVRT